MPKRYRSGRTKLANRAARFFKRRTLIRGRRTRAVSQIHKFRRGTTSDLAVNAGATDQLNNYSFALSAVENSSEFTALYDDYRITGVSIRYMPQFDRTNFPMPPATVPVTSQTRPIGFFCMDWDSSPSTLSDMRQYSTYGVFDLFRPKKWFIKPQPATIDNRTSSKKQWIDMAFPTMVYRGLSIGVPATTSFVGTQPIGTLQMRYYFECKHSR